MNLAGIIEHSAFYFPDRPAISGMVSEMTYRALNEQANQVATALIRLGVSPGDRIALCAPNSLEWVIFYFGVLKAGAAAVCISSMVTAHELKQAVTDAEPKCIFTTNDRIQDLEPLRQPGLLEKIVSPEGDVSFECLYKDSVGTFEVIDRERNDTAVILFTGGTTGIAKGVMLSHENIYSAIYNVVFNERSTENDRALCFLPLHHVFAQMHIMNATLLSGGCLEILIITGGENVYPREVEEVLYTIPGVEECAVIGLPDNMWGERVTAIIVPASGHTLDAASLKTSCKEKLSAFKVPKEFRMVNILPKSPAGKILKRTLRKDYKVRGEDS